MLDRDLTTRTNQNRKIKINWLEGEMDEFTKNGYGKTISYIKRNGSSLPVYPFFRENGYGNRAGTRLYKIKAFLVSISRYI